MAARQTLIYPFPQAVAQAISRHVLIALVLGLLLLLPGHTGAAGSGTHPSVSDDFPAWFKQSFLDLPQDLAEAGRDGKRGIMLLFSIRGCPYCKMLVERSLADPLIEATLRRYFDVIHLDIRSEFDLKDPQGRTMTVRAFAAREGASFSPTVAFYGLDGRALLRVVGYQTPARFRTTMRQAIGISEQPEQPLKASVDTSGKQTD